MKISLDDARKLALHAQRFGKTGSTGNEKENAAQLVEHLGYVQIDTIHIVERAHHHTLWARLPEYTPALLDELLSKDRRVFEWWTHAMSYIPMRDYRFYAPRMGRHALWGRQTEWLEAHPDVVAHVKDRIRAEGPLGAADFKKPEGFNGGWWEWKPAKQALEILSSMGELMVTKRRNFQRIFDLSERVLPPGLNMTPPDDAELQRFIIRFALNGRGILRESEVAWSRRKADPAALRALVDAGEVVALEVEGLKQGSSSLNGEPCYALSAALDAALATPPTQSLHILSPFDNLIIDRRWLKAFFDGFDYTLECYLPAAKRKYGYFVLPILWTDANGHPRFIARMDVKADRKAKTLIVRRLFFEPEVNGHANAIPALADSLRDYAAFNHCNHVILEETMPETIKETLAQMMK
ncbi:MAG: YcaQ family DNA glycosylase [Anaerolineae bacterium]|nr:YcaQ family DNA glycosylase [Anaerolineae bacterium]